MRTSEEIYHRVRWDSRFDPARFVLGVAQRGTVPKRVPLPRFTPGGDIPWHRVLFIEADGEVVWDRSSGVDRIDATDAGRVRAPRRLPSPYFVSRTPYAFSAPDAAWAPVSEDAPAPAPSSGPLTLLTWNTLWDRYDSDRIDTARRRPLLLDALRAADADVIALQEAEPALLSLLLATPWVRGGYTLWADPAGRDVADCGLLLLSRVPVREAGLHALGPHKAVAAVVVDGPGGPVTVAATHLSSDHSPDGARRRDAELADLATGLAAIEGELALLGDFNDGGDTPQDRLGMTDAWSRVHGPDDRTPTFDPSVNPLAAVSSLTGRVSRLDRVLVRPDGLRPASAVLLGDVPAPDGLYVSDHFGVRVELAADAAEEAAGTDPAEEERAAGIVRRVAAALSEGRVHLSGSRRMGCALPGADVDLVAALPGAVDLPGVRLRLAAALPDAEGLREVTGARVPGLRFSLDGLGVDLVTVATGGLAPAAAVSRRAELGGAAATALSAVSDAEAVLAAADPHRVAFTRLAREVKGWARARGLDSAPCGGLPGLAWAVLAARTAHESGDLPPLPLLRHFFATWAAWDWDRPVGSATAPDTGGLSVTVLTPTAPVRSCTTQVSPPAATWSPRNSSAPGRSWSPPPTPAPYRAPCSTPRRRCTRATPPGRSSPCGTARTRALPRPPPGPARRARGGGFPDAHAWPRPCGTDASHVQYAIGLGRTPPDGFRLAEIGARLLRGIPEAGLRRADRAQAPDLR